MKNSRYPGLKPFETGEQKIFYGREDDIEQLYKQIMLEKLVVLYSKSGYGKSSLLNAGIVPKIQKEAQMLIFPVRFGAYVESEIKTENLLNQILIQTIKQSEYYPKTKVSEIFTQYANVPQTLWYHLKLIQFSKGVVPLFIFDQFEEIFTYPEADIDAFATQLAALLNAAMPQEVATQLKTAFRNVDTQNIASSVDTQDFAYLQELHEPLKINEC